MKAIKFAAVGLGIMGLVTVGLSFAAVKDTPHNLGSTGPGAVKTASTTQVCVFCHTPHGADRSVTGVALWNRATDATGFQMYSGGEMVKGAAPAAESLLCLSCHDGVTALDSLFNGPTNAVGAYDYDPTGASRGWTFGTGSVMPDGITRIGKDLRNDHPVSVTYDPSATSNPLDWVPLATVQLSTSGVKLFGAANDEVECASCHTPHTNSRVPFLRSVNDGSAMCLKCHVK